MEVDLIILGGGCAGLSLGLELAHLKKNCPNTVILEKRDFYSNDRTWGFWEKGTDHYSGLVTKRFSKMKVSDVHAAHLIDCGKTPYAVLPAIRFYEYAREEITANNQIRLILGSWVTSHPVKKGERWEVRTPQGTYFAKSIVDTRPGALPQEKSSGLWQSFYGVEVECERDVFNPHCLDLMSFELQDRYSALFTYLVPSSKNRALIEITVFDKAPQGKADLESKMLSTLSEKLSGNPFTILREEAGILPMGVPTQVPSSDQTYVRTGLMSGAARPSTGYAFQRIQSWAILCASEIENGRPLMTHPRDPWLVRIMDKIFISVLRSRPHLAPQLFLSLFSKVAAPRLIRFLSGVPTQLDCLRIMLALPTVTFLTELPKVFRIRSE